MGAFAPCYPISEASIYRPWCLLLGYFSYNALWATLYGPLSKTNLPFCKANNGIVAAIRLTPRARQKRVTGLGHLEDGALVIKAYVTSPPDKGKANKALVKLLSNIWGVGTRSLSLIEGSRDRYKSVLIIGEANILMPKRNAWLKTIKPPE